ncbi:MAG: alpha/beta fold hydrolase [Acidiferrobacterales bacterium]
MTRKRLMFVLLSGFLTLVLVVAVGVLIAGQVARGNLAKRFPPPGIMVAAGDHRLHVFCEGSGPVTVLIQAGLNDFSVQWRQVQSLLSKRAKTCTYDRANMGWSEASAQPATLKNMVADMHAVITAVAPREPLVLLGHSFGGVIVRAYAQTHAANIKAMVLVEPANEFMGDQINGYAEVLTKVSDHFKTLAILADTGLKALQTEKITSSHLTGNALQDYRAVLATGEFFHGASKETAAMISNLQAMQKIGRNETIRWPVVIISRGRPDPIDGLPEASANSLEKTWAGLQADLVKRLSAKQIIARKSPHSVQFSEPNVIYDAVLPFLSK